MSNFIFTGEIELKALEKDYGTPANGKKPIKSFVFANTEDKKNINFMIEFSHTNKYEFLEYNTEFSYEGMVWDEWYQISHKFYRNKFLYLEPFDLEPNYEKEMIATGKGRLYDFPGANENLVDIKYYIKKINGKYRFIKIEWSMDNKVYERWRDIQNFIKGRRSEFEN